MVTVSLESPLYEVEESTAVAVVCLEKDVETADPLPIIMQPFEVEPTMPNVFQAKGTLLQLLTFHVKIYINICSSSIIIGDYNNYAVL